MHLDFLGVLKIADESTQLMDKGSLSLTEVVHSETSTLGQTVREKPRRENSLKFEVSSEGEMVPDGAIKEKVGAWQKR
jgi:hypothetical protein